VHVLTVPLIDPKTIDEVSARITKATFRPAGTT